MNSSNFTDPNPQSEWYSDRKTVIVVCPEEASKTFAQSIEDFTFVTSSDGINCPYGYQIRIHPDLHEPTEDEGKAVTLLVRKLRGDWQKLVTNKFKVSGDPGYPRSGLSAKVRENTVGPEEYKKVEEASDGASVFSDTTLLGNEAEGEGEDKVTLCIE